jgi:galactokinase
VNGREFADALAVAGLDPLELAAKARLYDSVLSAFHEITAEPPAHVCWVPGRLEVFGTHTDYAGGRTLVSALPRGFVFVGTGRHDGMLQAVDAVAHQAAAFDTTRPPPDWTGWRHYVDVVVGRLARNFPGAALGADLAFGSDLPRAAGMSSSSALMVGLAATLIRASGIRTRAEWLANISGPQDEASYYACIENGRTFRALAGDAGVGTHGGSEDHAAMVCSRAGAFSAYEFVPMRHLETIRLPEEWRMVVASSGVAAEKTGGALEPYNRLAAGAAVLLDLWNRSETPAVSLAAALSTGPSAPAQLRKIIERTSVHEWPAAALKARLQHFIREDARIPEAVRAFREGNSDALTELAAASQSDAQHLLRNQVDEAVELTRLALPCGAFATRSFGAGFGGSVWALAERPDAEAFATRWLDAYRARYPGLQSVTFIAQPGPGVVELADLGRAR